MHFEKLDYKNWKRKGIFERYTKKRPAYVTVASRLDCTKFYKAVKKNGMKMLPCFLYMLGRAVNSMQNFKLCYNENGELGYTDVLHPSFTHLYKGEEFFTIIGSKFSENFNKFYNTVLGDYEKCKGLVGFDFYEKKMWNDDKVFSVSIVPLCDFTSVVAQEFKIEYETDFAPFIVLGKITKKGLKRSLPVAIRCNHASADGLHISLLFNKIQEEFNNFSKYLAKKA